MRSPVRRLLDEMEALGRAAVAVRPYSVTQLKFRVSRGRLSRR